MVTLRLEDLGTRYGRVHVVSGVSTPVLTGGDVIAVIGPNAAGKSSLFKRIAGLAKGGGKVHVETTAYNRNTPSRDRRCAFRPMNWRGLTIFWRRFGFPIWQHVIWANLVAGSASWLPLPRRWCVNPKSC